MLGAPGRHREDVCHSHRLARAKACERSHDELSAEGHAIDKQHRQRTKSCAMSAPVIQVLLAEDHPIYRQGLMSALEHGLPGVQCEGVATASEALMRLQSGQRFDVLLADYRLPDRDGLALLADVRRGWPTLTCVLVSGSDDPRVIDKAIELGCLGFVPKSLEPEVLVGLLSRVLSGEPYFPARGDLSNTPLRFTDRQLAVLQRVALGLTSRAIAAELGIGERTVKDHLAVIYGRLDASTRAGAVARAAALNLIDLRLPTG